MSKKNINPFEYIHNKKYVINLEKRADRLESVCKEIYSHMRDYSFSFKSWKAISIPDNPVMGCYLSHMNILLSAYENFHSEVIVLEDDIDILEYDSQYLSDCMRELPKDWQFLFFSANILKPQKRHSKSLFNLDGFHGMWAYMFNPNNIDRTALARYLSFGLGRIPVDVAMSQYISRECPGKAFVCDRFWISQKKDHSDIEGKEVDYTLMLKERAESYLNDKTIK